MRAQRVDVVIVGAGLAGLAAAAAIRQRAPALSIVLVDALGEPPAPDAEGPGLRVSAIAPASRALCERAGAWKRLPDTHHTPMLRMRVWDAGVDCGEGIVFDALDLGRCELAQIVDNAALRFALYQTLADDPSVRFEVAGLAAVEQTPGKVSVALDTGTTISARLLVGADGRRSRVRSLCGMAMTRWAHDQRALVTHLACELAHDGCALQRFLPDGPLALLPLPDGRVSLVWSTTPAHAETLLAMDDARFADSVTAASDGVLGQLSTTAPRAAFPLVSQVVRSPVAARSVLIGDAAHAVHPLAGQGANLGFDDAAVLAEVVADARSRRADIGDPPELRRFRRQRKADSLSMVYGLDFINRLFGRERGALADLRRLGMRVFDGSPLAKQLAASHAMGSGGLRR